jgi:bacteriocin-like protein
MANEETTKKTPSPDDLVKEANSIELNEKELESVSGGSPDGSLDGGIRFKYDLKGQGGG